MNGALSMRFRALLSILCVSLISALVGVHVSAPYVRIGMIHVCVAVGGGGGGQQHNTTH